MATTRAADVRQAQPESVTTSRAAQEQEFEYGIGEVRRQGDTKARLSEKGGGIILDYGSHMAVIKLPADVDAEEIGIENFQSHGDDVAAALDAARPEGSPSLP